MSQQRAAYLSGIKRVVIKLGTQILSDAQSQLDLPYLNQVARQIPTLRESGIQVTIVSSGAIGAGLRELGLAKRPTDLAKLQAIAAVGQRKLMDAWADAFNEFKLPVAQVLLTRQDIETRKR